MTVKALKLTFGETLQVFAGYVGDWTQSSISDEKKLEKVIQRVHADMLRLRESYRQALADVYKYENPEKGTGLIPELEERLARYDVQGRKWTVELEAIQADNPDTYRRLKIWKQLDMQLNALDEKITADERSLANYRDILKTHQETLALCEAEYQKAKTSHESLVQYGPAIVQQMNAKRDAIERRDAARKQEGTQVDATAVLAELQEEMDSVGSEFDAEMAIEEEDASVDIDALMEDETEATARSERRGRWSSNN